jgi:anti-anti-sigma factor
MPDQTQAPFLVEVIGDIAVVRFAGWKVPMDVGEPLYKIVEEQKFRRVLLDLGEVTYMSSNAIGIFVTFKKRADAVGASIKVCRMHPDLVELLHHTRVDRIFSIYADEPAALASF